MCVYAASVLVFRPVTQYGLVGRSNPEDGRSMFLRNVRVYKRTRRFYPEDEPRYLRRHEN
jgi:hypothetical protein